MKSILRLAACISSLITFAFAGSAIAQMQPQQRVSAFPMQQPTARMATGQYANKYNPAVQIPRTGNRPATYGYGPKTVAPTMQRPVTRVAQAYGPMQRYTGVPAPSAVPSYKPAAPKYVGPQTIMPTAPVQVSPEAAVQALTAPQALIGATPMGAPATGAIGQMPTNQIPMVAPTQHIIDGGGGCDGGGIVDGGYMDMGYAGEGMVMGGDVGYVGGDCGGVPEAPVYAPTVDAAPTWFGGFYGLIMNRNDGNDICFLREPGSFTNKYLSTRDAAMEPAGGYEVRFGRIFNGGSWGMEFVYWELFPEDQIAGIETARQPVTQLYTDIDYSDVFFDGGVSGSDLFGNSGTIVAARIRRGFSFQNIELNLLSGPLYGGGGLRAGQATPFGQGYAGMIGDGGCYGGGYGPSIGAGCGGGSCGGGSCGSPCNDLYGGACGTGGCGPALQVGWLFGLRYFKFDDSLGVDYDTIDNVYDGGPNEFRHDVVVENDLVGAQLGLNLNYALTNCLCLDGGTRFGLFGNHITSRQTIQSDAGLAYLQDAAGNETDFDFVGDDDGIAFLGEMRFGAAYKIGCHWRLSGGYRALALSGVGLAQNELIGKVGDVDRNGHLILHGAYAGVEFCW